MYLPVPKQFPPNITLAVVCRAAEICPSKKMWTLYGTLCWKLSSRLCYCSSCECHSFEGLTPQEQVRIIQNFFNRKIAKMIKQLTLHSLWCEYHRQCFGLSRLQEKLNCNGHLTSKIEIPHNSGSCIWTSLFWLHNFIASHYFLKIYCDERSHVSAYFHDWSFCLNVSWK